jgi:ProP effector
MNTPNTAPGQEAVPAPAPAASVQAARALIKELQEKFAVFRDCQPLAIGIDKQLLARLPDLDRKVLRTALRFHTHSLRYLKAMEKATVRFDLEGNPADEVTEAHRSHASETIRERFKKDAEQRKAQRQAEENERKRTEKLGQLAAKFSRRSN